MEHPATGSLSIRFIDARQALPLRAAILRPGKPLEAALIPGEEAAASFHLGAFRSLGAFQVQPGSVAANEPIAVASFLPNVHPAFPDPSQYQLRGMAADPVFRGLGAGRALIRFSMNYLKENNVTVLWCNAREEALPFYTKCGFIESGDLFYIPGVGLHKLMYILPG